MPGYYGYPKYFCSIYIPFRILYYFRSAYPTYNKRFESVVKLHQLESTETGSYNNLTVWLQHAILLYIFFHLVKEHLF